MITLPVLMYHGVGDKPPGMPGDHLFVSADKFMEQVRTLVGRGYRSMRMAELGECLSNSSEPPEKRVALTFDDGFRANFYTALPTLSMYGWTGTFYVVALRTGETADWSPKARAPLLTWDQVLELHGSGMEIGSHTLTHPDLTRLNREDMRKEIFDSKKILEDKLGAPVRSFCYPYGGFNSEVERTVREAGYTNACSVMRGNRHGYKDLFRISRIHMHQRVSSLRLIYRTSALYHWEHSLKKHRD